MMSNKPQEKPGYWQAEFLLPECKNWNATDCDFADALTAEGFAMRILSTARPDEPIYRHVNDETSILFFAGSLDGSGGHGSADATVHFVSLDNQNRMAMVRSAAYSAGIHYAEAKRKTDV